MALLSVTTAPNPDVIRRLIELGVDVNAKDRSRWTPLHFGARTGSTPAARLLIDARAEIDAEDNDGITPLHRSVVGKPKNLEIVEMLLAAGARTHKALKLINAIADPQKAAMLALFAKYQKTGPAAAVEQEWLACDDPNEMLALLRNKVSERKCRLFACACLRRLSQLLNQDGMLALRAVEDTIDGRASEQQVAEAGARAASFVEQSDAARARADETLRESEARRRNVWGFITTGIGTAPSPGALLETLAEEFGHQADSHRAQAARSLAAIVQTTVHDLARNDLAELMMQVRQTFTLLKRSAIYRGREFTVKHRIREEDDGPVRRGQGTVRATKVAAWVRQVNEGLERELPGSFDRALANERDTQAILLRHIFGTPFRPYPAPSSWPAPVAKLAEALYAGEDCSFALHDGLLEAGHPELAEHFKEKEHPKGCWVVDLVLGKE